MWGRTGGRTLRPVSTAITFLLAVAVASWAVFDAARVDGWAGLRWGAAAVIVVWLLWLVLWRPSMRIREDEVDVVNGLRTWTIPWTRVAEVGWRLQCVLVLDDGRRVTAWGSPTTGRGASEPRSAADIRLLASRAAGTGDPAPVRRRTAWGSLAIPVGATLCLTAIALISVVPGP